MLQGQLDIISPCPALSVCPLMLSCNLPDIVGKGFICSYQSDMCGITQPLCAISFKYCFIAMLSQL